MNSDVSQEKTTDQEIVQFQLDLQDTVKLLKAFLKLSGAQVKDKS